MTTPLDLVLGGLMRRYQARVPQVKAILDAMCEEGIIASPDEIENDHIAFRTLGIDHLGIQSFEKIFLHYGYERRERYDFVAKRLNAYWYAPPSPKYPRIFVSELRVHELSDSARFLIDSYTSPIERDPVDALDLDDGLAVDAFLHRPLWAPPTWEEYSHLAQESEYAAWVMNNRFYLNHFTISVHNLPQGYNTVSKFNEFLERFGFHLNDSGGKVKQSPDGLLLQSATVANMLETTFRDGKGGTVTKSTSGSYVEFAERRVLPAFQDVPSEQIRREHRRDGFATKNADKIFESTYRSQTSGNTGK